MDEGLLRALHLLVEVSTCCIAVIVALKPIGLDLRNHRSFCASSEPAHVHETALSIDPRSECDFEIARSELFGTAPVAGSIKRV